MITLINMILSFITTLAKMFCTFLPPGLHSFVFFGEPDFSVIQELNQKR